MATLNTALTCSVLVITPSRRGCWRDGLALLPALALILALMPAPALAGHAAGPAADDTWGYTLEAGDTLIGVRDRLLVPQADWRALQRLNRITQPRRLKPGAVLHIPLALLREQALDVEVLHTQGDVWVQHGDAVDRQTLATGQALAMGDQVSTGARSSVVIRWGDGTRLLLRPDSQLRLLRSVLLGPSGRRETALHLQSGGADTQVPPASAPGLAPITRPRLQLRTPLVNLAVRGTEFRTLASAERTRVEVLAGQVAVAGQVIEGGFGSVASARGLEPVRALLAAPDLGALAQRVERLPLDLQWPAQPGAAAYRAQVFDADGDQPQRLRLDGLFAKPGARWADDLPDGVYTLRVRGADAAGLEGRDAQALFTLKARPEPPFIVEPRDASSSTDALIRFHWTTHPAASFYRLQVADNPAFDPLRHDLTGLVETEIRLALPVGTHRWRLASVRGTDDRGPWSDSQTVTRAPLPPPPPAPLPPRLNAQGVLLGWAQSPREGTAYDVQVARDAGFTLLLADERTAQPFWLLRQPEPGSYHVRVRAVDGDGLTGAFGAAQQIDVPSSQQRWWWWLLPALLLLV